MAAWLQSDSVERTRVCQICHLTPEEYEQHFVVHCPAHTHCQLMHMFVILTQLFSQATSPQLLLLSTLLMPVFKVGITSNALASQRLFWV